MTWTPTIGKPDTFVESLAPFFEYLKDWEEGLESRRLDDLIDQAGGPERVALLSADMIEGFCRIGPLASPRVEALIEPVVALFEACHQRGVRRLAVVEDAHSKDAPEFEAYPPHCIEGTDQAETIRELRELPFYDEIRHFKKNSINGGIDTGLGDWVAESGARTILLVGDCTDICVYQAATYLRTLANQRKYDWTIVVPANAVDTYDTPVEEARKAGAPAHPADLVHLLFLYHLWMNNITTVREIE
jgi:nicotinamidase-related amidase